MWSRRTRVLRWCQASGTRGSGLFGADGSLPAVAGGCRVGGGRRWGWAPRRRHATLLRSLPAAVSGCRAATADSRARRLGCGRWCWAAHPLEHAEWLAQDVGGGQASVARGSGLFGADGSLPAVAGGCRVGGGRRWGRACVAATPPFTLPAGSAPPAPAPPHRLSLLAGWVGRW